MRYSSSTHSHIWVETVCARVVGPSAMALRGHHAAWLLLLTLLQLSALAAGRELLIRPMPRLGTTCRNTLMGP